MASFQDRVIELRAEKEYSMSELGKLLGLGREAIYKYEHGIVINPKQAIVKKMADIFGVSPQYILGYTDER
jgi:repressor LexA